MGKEILCEGNNNMALGIDFGNGINSLLSRKKKTVTAKASSSDGAVAQAVAHFTGKKVESLKKKLDERSMRLKTEERIISDKQKALATLKRTASSLEEKYKALAAKKRAELVKEYRQAITKLKLHPMVEKFEVDTNKRIIITTRPIKIQKPSWPQPREAGVYQIRIDFSQENYTQGVRILNITQRYQDSYDSPTINESKPCWGNIGLDIDAEFSSQDLYELIVDLIEYISSPNDNHGYLSSPGATSEDKKGWEQWLSNLKKQPKGFCFEKFTQENHMTESASLPTDLTDPLIYAAYGPFMSNATILPTAQIIQEPTPSQPDNISIETIDLRIQIQEILERLGFIARSASHFAHMVVDTYPSANRFRLTNENRRLVLKATSPSGIREFFINQDDLEVEVGRAIMRRNGVSSEEIRIDRRQQARPQPSPPTVTGSLIRRATEETLRNTPRAIQAEVQRRQEYLNQQMTNMQSLQNDLQNNLMSMPMGGGGGGGGVSSTDASSTNRGSGSSGAGGMMHTWRRFEER